MASTITLLLLIPFLFIISTVPSQSFMYFSPQSTLYNISSSPTTQQPLASSQELSLIFPTLAPRILPYPSPTLSCPPPIVPHCLSIKPPPLPPNPLEPPFLVSENSSEDSGTDQVSWFFNESIPVGFFFALHLGVPFAPSYVGQNGTVEDMVQGVNYDSAGARICSSGLESVSNDQRESFTDQIHDYVKCYLQNASIVQNLNLSWSSNPVLECTLKNRIKNLYVMSVRKVELPSSNALFCDKYGASIDIIEKYKHYGFNVSTNACCGWGRYRRIHNETVDFVIMCISSEMACNYASNPIWWDRYNPTDAEGKAVQAKTCNPMS